MSTVSLGALTDAVLMSADPALIYLKRAVKKTSLLTSPANFTALRRIDGRLVDARADPMFAANSEWA
jgi:hypothetical protein